MKTEATEKEKIFSYHKHKSNHKDLEYICSSQINPEDKYKEDEER